MLLDVITAVITEPFADILAGLFVFLSVETFITQCKHVNLCFGVYTVPDKYIVSLRKVDVNTPGVISI